MMEEAIASAELTEGGLHTVRAKDMPDNPYDAERERFVDEYITKTNHTSTPDQVSDIIRRAFDAGFGFCRMSQT